MANVLIGSFLTFPVSYSLAGSAGSEFWTLGQHLLSSALTQRKLPPCKQGAVSFPSCRCWGNAGGGCSFSVASSRFSPNSCLNHYCGHSFLSNVNNDSPGHKKQVAHQVEFCLFGDVLTKLTWSALSPWEQATTTSNAGS